MNADPTVRRAGFLGPARAEAVENTARVAFPRAAPLVSLRLRPSPVKYTLNGTMKENPNGLFVGHPAPGISSDRAAVIVPVLELSAARVSRATIASPRVPVLTPDNPGLRLDGEYGPTDSGN